MKHALVPALLLLLATGLVACGDTSEPAPDRTDARASDAADRQPEEASVDSDRVGGTLNLRVNGEEKSFPFFPADKNMAMSMSTMILARPSAEATEEFSMMVMNFDVRSAELPVSLELGLREAMESGDPAGFARAPKPLISYISPEGVDYSSYAGVVFERAEDGMVSGRVEDIELEPSDGDGPPVMLTDIRFEVALFDAAL